MTTSVTETEAAVCDVARRHFEDLLTFETDCWDVHESLETADFILLDVRGPVIFAKGHIPGAVNIPYGKMTAVHMSDYPQHKLFVVYCAGPHCNGADKNYVRVMRFAHAIPS